MIIPKPKTYQQWKEPTTELLWEVITLLPRALRIQPRLLANDLVHVQPVPDIILHRAIVERWAHMLVNPDHYSELIIETTKPIIKKPKTYNQWRRPQGLTGENFLDAGFIWAPYIPINL